MVRVRGGGGGGIGFRIVGFHRNNCSDFGSGEYFADLYINTADLSNILARIVDLACNVYVVRILDCDFIVELLADFASNLGGSVDLYTPIQPPPLVRVEVWVRSRVWDFGLVT